MKKIPYSPPQFQVTAFNCPICGAFANQNWKALQYRDGNYHLNLTGEAHASFCSHCEEYAIWHRGKMLYPVLSGIELPNQDLNEEICTDYLEASEVLQRSPRSASALLRLAVHKLCEQLGENGNDLNKNIGNLVARGLPIKVQESLDTLRVIGNEAVHPGQLNLRDDVETASALFKLINFIAEKLITEPREIEELYVSKVPDEKKAQIIKRDTK